MKQEFRKTSELKLWEDNPRNIKLKDFERLKKQIQELGQYKPLLITEDGTVIGGNMRLRAYMDLGIQDVWVSVVNPKDDNQMLAYALSDNDRAGYYDDDLLANLSSAYPDFEWGNYAVDLAPPTTLDDLFKTEVEEDEVPEVDETSEPVSKLGEVYQLGRHRLMCGDSTKIEDVEKLMNGQKADMVFTDPPYGMKKENEGVLNDNLNYDDLLAFNKEWIPLSFLMLKDVGSWYCWGTDEPLMDIYSEIVKPYIKDNKATFRNLITWDKGNGQGQNSEETRMYATADEKCLFLMMGVQGFNTNKDNYYDGWEGIRYYLDSERMKMGWGVDDVIRITGKTSASHYFTKSQWTFPTKEHYESIQKEAGNEGFKKDYEEIKKDYEEIKKDYEEIKKEYYSTRAYFDNTHDNMNNVWHISRDVQNQDHATPKPLELCQRAIKSSSRENESVLDLFGGSGSTLIACEQLNRTCYMMELDPKYCDVIRKRYAKFIGKEDQWEEVSPKI